MRTLFLLGILGALIVIATKNDNQTAMEAAVEIGQKAQSLVADYDNGNTVNDIIEKAENAGNIVGEKSDPFVRQVKKAIANPKTTLSKNELKFSVEKMAEKTTDPAALIPDANHDASADKQAWVMPKPPQLAIPNIPAIPKAKVEALDIDAEPPVTIAIAEPAPVDVGRSYDLVKGYYENASRLLEEIK